MIHYGSFHVLGTQVLTNVYNIFTLTPERIMRIPCTKRTTDYFAIGILLICIQMGVDLQSDYSISRYWQAITSILSESNGPSDDLSLKDRSHILFPKNLVYGDKEYPDEDPTVNKVISKLLILDPFKRECCLELFDRKPYFPPLNDDYLPDIQLHLWKLCGKSIERNLLDSKFIHVSSSIIMLHQG